MASVWLQVALQVFHHCAARLLAVVDRDGRRGQHRPTASANSTAKRRELPPHTSHRLAGGEAGAGGSGVLGDMRASLGRCAFCRMARHATSVARVNTRKQQHRAGCAIKIRALKNMPRKGIVWIDGTVLRSLGGTLGAASTLGWLNPAQARSPCCASG